MSNKVHTEFDFKQQLIDFDSSCYLKKDMTDSSKSTQGSFARSTQNTTDEISPRSFSPHPQATFSYTNTFAQMNNVPVTSRDQPQDLVTIVQPSTTFLTSGKQLKPIISEAMKRQNLLLRLQKIKPSVVFKSSSKKNAKKSVNRRQ